MPLEPAFDWHCLHAEKGAPPRASDSRRRIRICLAGFLGLLAMVFGRVVQLEWTQGAAFRYQAGRPIEVRHGVPGVRGRILARDGTVLARDEEKPALAVHYRWLQEPPDPRWLRLTARSRLSRRERTDPDRVAAEEARLHAERAEVMRGLARLAGLSADEWQRRSQRIQARVERISDSVNRRRFAAGNVERARDGRGEPPRPPTWLGRLGSCVLDFLRASMDEPPARRMIVAEELDYHVVAEDVPLAVVAEIQSRPDRYPCVQIVHRARRAYPQGRLAAHVLGYVGAVPSREAGGRDLHHPDDRVGRTGIELQYDRLLRGTRGEAVEWTDRSGRILTSYRQREPGIGRDVVLTLDTQLQRAAEELVESARHRRAALQAEGEPAGAAIVVMDVRNGAILAAASAPAYDPNVFAGGEASEIEPLMHDPAHPLFDRVLQMAIPPGSVFKTVSAMALLEASAVAPTEPFFCRGYLHHPDRWRCAIFTRHASGHGEVNLADALAQSCNVYFFHHAGRMGPEPLVRWASRFGIGRTTGVDLPYESSGTLPMPSTIVEIEGHPWRAADTQALAIGQGSLRVTPLQVARMMAAVANGGRLVTPHLACALGLPELPADATAADGTEPAEPAEPGDDPLRVAPAVAIPDLDAGTLAAVREGLERVVSDPSGTAYATVALDSVAIAGKTGTAETGPGRAEHAWFAGYAPAHRPQVAFVVVVEHGGDAASGAGPIARRLVDRMQRQGYFARAYRTATAESPVAR